MFYPCVDSDAIRAINRRQHNSDLVACALCLLCVTQVSTQVDRWNDAGPMAAALRKSGSATSGLGVVANAMSGSPFPGHSWSQYLDAPGQTSHRQPPPAPKGVVKGSLEGAAHDNALMRASARVLHAEQGIQEERLRMHNYLKEEIMGGRAMNASDEMGPSMRKSERAIIGVR